MGNCFIRHRSGKKKLKTRSLYSFCTNINKSGTYSETISGIKYDIECVTVPEVTDSNVDTIFNSVSSNEGYFLLLKTNHINISETLTPPYPKKSLIIFCPTIEGTGTISMTGKGPNVLPEDILLFEEKEVKEINKVLIPAYANNAKNILIKAFINDSNSRYVINRKGIDGTGYNCGSGGIGGCAVNNANRQCANWRVISGSGYSYGGGAGAGGYHGETTAASQSTVDATYPMRGSSGVNCGLYYSCGGAGNPQGAPNPVEFTPGSNKISGVGGRVIVFTKKCSISNIEAKGKPCIPYPLTASAYTSYSNGHIGVGGSSGGGSINVFYTVLDTSAKNASGGDYNPRYNSDDFNDNGIRTGGAGGNGTVVNTKCKKLAVYKI